MVTSQFRNVHDEDTMFFFFSYIGVGDREIHGPCKNFSSKDIILNVHGNITSQMFTYVSECFIKVGGFFRVVQNISW